MGTGYAGPGWEWPSRPLTAILRSSCAATSTKGGRSEQILNIITYDMALPISHCLGTKVSLPDLAGDGKRSGGIRHPSDLWIRRV